MAKIKEILPEGFKRCSKCGEVKRVEEFGKDKSKSDGIRCCCKSCLRIRSHAYYVKNIIKTKENGKKWRSKNIDRVREINRKGYNKNRTSILSNQKKYGKYNTELSSNMYVIKLLKIMGLQINYITPELIELKRQIIKTKRVIKNKKNHEEH